MDLWSTLTGGKVHAGSWFGLPDIGLTEKAARATGNPINQQGGSNLFGVPSNQQIQQQQQNLAGSNAIYQSTSPSKVGPVIGPTRDTLGASTGPTSGGGGVNGDVLQSALATAGASQEDAARAQAEERRRAAENAYNVTRQEAESAKGEAKGQYDWIVNTLGSQKADLLSKAALQEAQGLEEYAATEKKTRTEFDTAKRDTLTGYRDMKREQEKIFRGMGMGQSSRSLEAEMKLNTLLAKDVSAISAKEADSLALIGNAVSTLKQKASDLKMSVERETKSKVDQATLEFQRATNAINNNLFMAAGEREDRLNQANAQLQQDIAGIRTWKANAQVQVGLAVAQLTGNLDSFVNWAADSTKGLNASLPDKQTVFSQTDLGQGKVTTDQETGMQSTQIARMQAPKYQSAEEIQAAVSRGELDPAQAQQLIANLQITGGGGQPQAGSDLLAQTILGGSMGQPGVSPSSRLFLT